MKKLLLVFLLSVVAFVADAQIKLSGIVTDDNGEPLYGVVVKAVDAATNKMKAYAHTDANGAFALSVADDKCVIDFSLLGFKKRRIEKINAKEPLRIMLHENAVGLKEVTVKADKVRTHGDTLSYTVGAFADKNDRSLGDVLAKIPGFEVNKQNGEIKYEGKAISKFYVDGQDLLGGNYGVATNSLPQTNVGAVQVMKHHQPIRVLEDFTFTDDAAVNIRMKESAKSHWITTYNGGLGVSGNQNNKGLWKFEGLALRLKSDFQTMLTYKTNNIGTDINKETTNLLEAETTLNGKDYISLSAPSTPSLNENRTLFNRSHAVTANIMKRINEMSQWNLQLIYNNNRETAYGLRRTEYYLNGANKILENSKNYLSHENDLYALLKYERNGERQYLKNSFSGDFLWCRQWLDEHGTNNHNQTARKPVFDIKDNLYIIRKYGKKLISFYSDNRITSSPQSLAVDTLRQNVHEMRFSTDNYAVGGLKLGKINMSLKVGVNAFIHKLRNEALGMADSLGLWTDESKYGYSKGYVIPTFQYHTKDIDLQINPSFEYLLEKFSGEKSNNEFAFMPEMRIKWYATPRLRLSLGASSVVEALDASRFYRSLILQDFQYINKGYGGYAHDKSKAVNFGITYNDAMKALHIIANVSRDFSTSPFTPTRQFVGDYIILSAVEQTTKTRSWQSNLIFSKGLNLWHGIFNLRATYLDTDASMMQNGEREDYISKILNLHSSFDFSFRRNMHLRYGVTFGYNAMDVKSMVEKTFIRNYKHEIALSVPIDKMILKMSNEYYHNERISGGFKDFFLSDIKAQYKLKKIDIDLSLRNIFNKRVYSNVIVRDLVSSASINNIRARELMLSVYYHL